MNLYAYMRYSVPIISFFHLEEHCTSSNWKTRMVVEDQTHRVKTL